MTTLAGLEYTYINAPRTMQGVSVGLFYMVLGITQSASVSLSYSFNLIPGFRNFSGNSNDLYYIFFALGGSLLIYLVIFILVARQIRWN